MHRSSDWVDGTGFPKRAIRSIGGGKVSSARNSSGSGERQSISNTSFYSQNLAQTVSVSDSLERDQPTSLLDLKNVNGRTSARRNSWHSIPDFTYAVVQTFKNLQRSPNENADEKKRRAKTKVNHGKRSFLVVRIVSVFSSFKWRNTFERSIMW